MSKIALVFFLLLVCIQTFSQDHTYRVELDGNRVQTGFKLQGINGIITTLHGVAASQAKKMAVQHYHTKRKYLDNLTIRLIDFENDLCVISSQELDQLSLEEGYAESKAVLDSIGGKVVRLSGFPLGISGISDINLYLDNFKPVKQLQEYLPVKVALNFNETVNSPSKETLILALNGDMLPGHSGAPILLNNQLLGIADGGLAGGTVGFGWAIIWKKVKFVPFKDIKRFNDVRILNAALFNYDINNAYKLEPDEALNIKSKKQDIAISILDYEKQPVGILNDGMSVALKSHGKSVNISLFKDRFLQSDLFNALMNADHTLMEYLKIKDLADYIILGNIKYSYTEGKIIKYVCRVEATINIVSTRGMSIIKTLSLSTQYGFSDEQNAKLGALRKVLAEVNSNLSNISF